MNVRAVIFLALLPAALLSGCKKEEPVLPEYLSNISIDPVGVMVGTAIGNRDQVRIPIFATNAVGAAVPSEGITVTSTVTLESGTLTPGNDGWAEAVAIPGEVGAWSITASAGGASNTGTAYAAAATPGEVEFPAVGSGQASGVANAGNGLAWSVGAEVWWGTPGADGIAVPVLKLPDDVISITPVQADEDGEMDLMVHSASSLILLKGRSEGGLSWGAGFSDSGAWGGATVSAATVANLDNDTTPDLLVSLEKDGQTKVIWLVGDGLYGFTQTRVLDLAYKIFGVSAEDYDQSGEAEVTILTQDSLLRRYGFIEGDWIPATTADYDLEIGPGSRLLPSMDVNGDGSPDILAFGPSSITTGAQAWVVTAGAASPTRYRLFSAGQALPEWVGMSAGDVNGDGVADVVITAPDQLLRVIWNGPNKSPTIYVTSGVPVGMGVATGEFVGPNPDSSNLTDVVVGTAQGLVVFPGAETVDDPTTTDTDETVPWRVRSPSGTVIDLGLSGTPFVGDVTADGIADLVSFVKTDVSIGVRVFIGEPDNGEGIGFQGGNLLSLNGTGDALGVAVCGSTLHALLDTGEPLLYRFDIGLDGTLTQVGDPIMISGGTMLACGSFPAGDVVVANPSGNLTYVDSDGFVNAGESSAGVVGMAVRDPDGDGVATVEQCTEVGCAVVAGDMDGDGMEDVAVLSGGNLAVEAGGSSYVIPDAGVGLWLGDVDGDGMPELVTGNDNYWRTYRVVGGGEGGVLPADQHYILWPIAGRVSFGDLSGDGIPDLLVAARPDEDSTDAVDWGGRLIYSPSL